MPLFSNPSNEDKLVEIVAEVAKKLILLIELATEKLKEAN